MTLGQIFEQLFGPDTPIRFEGYDGSRAGDADATMTIRMVSPRAVSYLITAPGSLGLARAYLQGDLEIDGVHPGDPYELLRAIDALTLRRPSPAVALQWLRGLGLSTLKPPPLPDLEQVALPPARPRPAAQPQAGRHRDQLPLRRLQRLLRAGARAVDDLHLRLLPDRGLDAGAGPGAQVRPGRPQARADPGNAAAGRRLRLGRDGPARGAQLRRLRARGHALPRAGVLGQPADRGRGPGRQGRGAPP